MCGGKMQVYIRILGLNIPSYGFMILIGLVLANLCAGIALKKEKLNVNYFIALEGYCLMGAFLGAKLLFFIVSFNEIDWSRIFDLEYLNRLMQGGFVFYGGLIGGVVFVLLAGKLHKINAGEYLRSAVFMIPIMHGFGRIGCFMAGCCYGRPYDGVFAVVFPKESFAISGVPLFPVQLFEAGILLLLSVILMYLRLKKHWHYTLEVYLLTYAVIRFVLEFLRYDKDRGIYAGVSTSQWISILLFIVTSIYLIYSKKKKAKEVTL